MIVDSWHERRFRIIADRYRCAWGVAGADYNDTEIDLSGRSRWRFRVLCRLRPVACLRRKYGSSEI